MRLMRITGLTALALTATLGLAACGSSDDSSATGQSGATASAVADAGAQTFGPGCSAIPSTGAGSFTGMATDPVATAASNNPLLSTLVTAVSKAGLVDTLNAADGITVFAPTNDAFGKIPTKTLNAVLNDKDTLTAILTHHVVAGQLTPADLAGTHKTLNGDTITISGTEPDFMVGAENAQVLCGNIPTANATVYVIDTVLLP